MMFRDTMDPDRVVKVVTTQGNSNLCRVYFRHGKTLVYHGETRIPASLFAQNEQNNHIGFVLESKLVV